MQKGDMEQHKMLKRTERVIDAVKLIELLEGMEGKEARLTIKRTNEIWEFEYECDGEVIKETGDKLTGMAERAIAINRGKRNAKQL